MLNKLLFIGMVSLLTLGNTSAQDCILENYSLVWADEFETEALDLQNWGYRQLNMKRRDAFNSKETVSVSDGYLRLSTVLDSGVYKTSMISTQGRFESTYGYYETRVNLQQEIGHWSAFWLQTPNVDGDETDDVGKEIDIFEYLPNKRKKVQHALHRGAGDELVSSTQVVRNKNLKDDWHTFACEWTPDQYTFFVDGEITWITDKPEVSQNQKYIILSLEVGEWAGNIRRADLPDELLVDYVRVYQKVD